MWSVVLIEGSEVKVHTFGIYHIDKLRAEEFARDAIQERGFPKSCVHVVEAEEEDI